MWKEMEIKFSQRGVPIAAYIFPPRLLCGDKFPKIAWVHSNKIEEKNAIRYRSLRLRTRKNSHRNFFLTQTQIGALSRTPHLTLDTIVLWWSEGFQACPQLGTCDCRETPASRTVWSLMFFQSGVIGETPSDASHALLCSDERASIFYKGKDALFIYFYYLLLTDLNCQTII